MKKKSLLSTNPYLKDLKIRDSMIIQSAITSTAIEGVRISSNQEKTKKTKK